MVWVTCHSNNRRYFYSRYNKMIVLFTAAHTLTEVGFLMTYTIRDGTAKRSQTARKKAQFDVKITLSTLVSFIQHVCIKINCTHCFITGAKQFIIIRYCLTIDFILWCHVFVHHAN